MNGAEKAGTDSAGSQRIALGPQSFLHSAAKGAGWVPPQGWMGCSSFPIDLSETVLRVYTLLLEAIVDRKGKS